MIFVESVVALNFDASLSWVKVKNKFKKLWPELALYGKTRRSKFKFFEITLSSQPDVTLFVNLYTSSSSSTAVSVHLMYRPVEDIQHMLDLYTRFQAVEKRIKKEFELD